MLLAQARLAWASRPNWTRAEVATQRVLVVVLRALSMGSPLAAPVGDPGWVGEMRGDKALVLERQAAGIARSTRSLRSTPPCRMCTGSTRRSSDPSFSDSDA